MMLFERDKSITRESNPKPRTTYDLTFSATRTWRGRTTFPGRFRTRSSCTKRIQTPSKHDIQEKQNPFKIKDKFHSIIPLHPFKISSRLSSLLRTHEQEKKSEGDMRGDKGRRRRRRREKGNGGTKERNGSLKYVFIFQITRMDSQTTYFLPPWFDVRLPVRFRNAFEETWKLKRSSETTDSNFEWEKNY